jgi:RNA polymerase sigma-70 factor (ECF subfamily)
MSTSPALTPPFNVTDKSLLRRVARTDAVADVAASELYRRYAKRISGLARTRLSNALLGRVDEDDVVQSVFRSVIEKIRQGVYDVPDENTLWELLAVVTMNKVHSLRKYHSAGRRDVRNTVHWDELNLQGRSITTEDELTLAVAEILEKLPESHRDIVNLRMMGFSVAEIADKTGRSLRSTERILQSCRQYFIDCESAE